jgi:hypothetical protein
MARQDQNQRMPTILEENNPQEQEKEKEKPSIVDFDRVARAQNEFPPSSVAPDGYEQAADKSKYREVDV